MKKMMTIFGALLVASVMLTSCGVNSDAKKLANLECEIEQLYDKIIVGDESAMKEFERLSAKHDELTKEVVEKYTSESDQEKFDEAYEQALENCMK